MIEEDRYCIDISNQLLAAVAVLRKANREILRAHMSCCVREAVESGDAEQKIEELAALMEKL
jgi:DNA-binding FrmR family transcriptional regulator